MVPQRWVWGAYCPETGEGCLVFVKRRNAQTLLPLIVQNVAIGSLVWSDMWRAYNRVRDLRALVGGQIRRRYRHQSVNHSVHFVDPNSNCCTNRIENFWCHAKRKLKTMAGVQDTTLKSHLSEFMYRHRNGQDGTPIFNALIRDIVARYPV